MYQLRITKARSYSQFKSSIRISIFPINSSAFYLATDLIRSSSTNNSTNLTSIKNKPRDIPYQSQSQLHRQPTTPIHIKMDTNTPPPPHHPFGLTYILLLIGAWLIRIPAMLGARRSKESINEVLNQSKVSRTRINVPSRQKGRSIKVDVYEKITDEKKNEERKKGKFVHLNLHG